MVSSEDGAPVEDDAAGTYTFAEGCTQVFNGTTYVKQGEVSVNILPANNKYELVSVSVNGDPVYASEGTLYVFEMPAERTDIVVDYNFVQTKTVSVYSAIPFSYNGEYAAGLQDVAVGEEETLLSPSAAGYVFLGWAIGTDGSEELVFKTSDLSVEYKGVYYAVWAKSSREFTVTAPVEGGTAELPQISATDGTLFYQWCNGTDFSTAYSGITTQNTVVTARWQFKFTYSFGTPRGDSNVYEDGNRVVHNGKTMTERQVFVFEGDTVSISGFNKVGAVIVSYTDSTGQVEKEYTSFKTKWDWGNYSDDSQRAWKPTSETEKNQDHSYGGDGEGWLYDSQGYSMTVIVNGDITATING